MADNNKNLQSLLSKAAKQLGTSPEELKNSADKGDFSKLLGNMNPEDAKMLQKVLNDKDAANKVLSTPQAQELLQQLMGKKK